MKILVSNDDGIYAHGLTTLSHALSQIGEIKIVAPDRDRSGASNSLTLDNPLRVRRLDDDRFVVQGTPTDCVHLAITGLLDELPDVVVSGINDGSNLGDDIFYSGTVAAAMEGRFMGLPAIAISLVGSQEKRHYATAAEVAKRIVTRLASDPLPHNTILNINIPDLPFEAISGFEITRLGTRHRAENCVTAIDPRGHPIYWFGPPGAEQDAGAGTDFYAIAHNRVSITPVLLDLTHYHSFPQLKTWIKFLDT